MESHNLSLQRYTNTLIEKNPKNFRSLNTSDLVHSLGPFWVLWLLLKYSSSPTAPAATDHITDHSLQHLLLPPKEYPLINFFNNCFQMNK